MLEDEDVGGSGEEAGTEYVLKVRDKIKAQVRFWRDKSKVRGYVGGLGSGKTFAGGVEVLRQPAGSTGVVVAPTYGMMRDASQRTFFEICPPDLIVEHNKQEQRTELADGKTIFWRSADRPDSLRGPNLGWAWGDEWAFASEEAHKVVVGRLRRRPGKMWFTTTPNGQNWLYQWAVIRAKVLRYALHFGKTKDNPFNLSSYARDLERQYADDPLFSAQELEGKFVDISGTKRFPGPLVEACYEGCPTVATPVLPAILGPEGLGGERLVYTLPLDPRELRIYAWPVEGREYRLGVDCAEGLIGGDDSTVVVVDKLTGETVCVLAGEYEPTEEHGAYGAILSRWYNNAPAQVERNNDGKAVIGCLTRHGVKVLKGPDGRPGRQTTTQSKASMCADANAVLIAAKQEGAKLLPDHRLKEQIKGIDRKTLKGPGKGRSVSKGGGSGRGGRITKVDDEFIAWALAQTARFIEPDDDDVWFIV